MAKVTIVFEDKEDDLVESTVDFDPPTSLQDATPAGEMGYAVADWLRHRNLRSHSVEYGKEEG